MKLTRDKAYFKIGLAAFQAGGPPPAEHQKPFTN